MSDLEPRTPASAAADPCGPCKASPAPFDNSDTERIENEFWSIVGQLRAMARTA